MDLTAWALRRRPHNEIDRFDGERYQRVFMLTGGAVEVSVRQIGSLEESRLTVELTADRNDFDDAQLVECRSVLEITLGLGADLSGFYQLATNDPHLAALAARFRGVRPPHFPSVFEAVVNAAACQQLSLVVGIHLLNRLTTRFGSTACASINAPHAFPTPGELAAADPLILRDMGFSMAKARTIIELATRVASNDVDIEALAVATDEHAMATLFGLRGIGRWSAEYTLLRGLGRWHVLPGDDVGAANNLQRRFGLAFTPNYAQIEELTSSWSPYAGLVYFHLLLDSLDAGGHLAPATPESMVETRMPESSVTPRLVSYTLDLEFGHVARPATTREATRLSDWRPQVHDFRSTDSTTTPGMKGKRIFTQEREDVA